MKKIFYIMGRSGSGKDTIYKEILKNEEIKKINLKEIVLHTTRPMRNGEECGKEYYFVSDKLFEKMKNLEKFIEIREYDTVNGIWKYGTCADSITDGNFIGIGTLISYSKLKEKYGDCVYPIYISVDEDILYKRTVDRAKGDNNQNIEEVKRRFEADRKDFSNEKIKELNINKIFDNNNNLNDCVNNIVNYIFDKIENN